MKTQQRRDEQTEDREGETVMVALSKGHPLASAAAAEATTQSELAELLKKPLGRPKLWLPLAWWLDRMSA